MTNKPIRKRIRLREYDYSTGGAYHVTICTKRHAAVLCSVVGRADLCAPHVELTSLGQIVKTYIDTISETYADVYVDTYAIMPDHIHLLLRIDQNGAQGSARPTVSHIVRALKIMVRKQTGISPFQTSFYDHIIRGKEITRKHGNILIITRSNGL